MKTTVILEAGNNWETKDDILASIEFGRKHGNLIKFQAHGGMFEHLKKWAIPEEWMKEIAAPDVFYSVFSVEMLDWLEANVNPMYYKIASRSIHDAALVQRVVKTGKRVFQSVPMGEHHPSIPGPTYLHCVASYPAVCAHLYRVERFDGYSDHTTSTMIPALVVAKGAKVIEKHFSIREMETPDRPHSLLPHEWDEMMRNIRDAEYHLGL